MLSMIVPVPAWDWGRPTIHAPRPKILVSHTHPRQNVEDRSLTQTVPWAFSRDTSNWLVRTKPAACQIPIYLVSPICFYPRARIFGNGQEWSHRLLTAIDQSCVYTSDLFGNEDMASSEESRSGSPHATSPGNVPRRRLDLWKEIASYLNRSEKTVRRWE